MKYSTRACIIVALALLLVLVDKSVGDRCKKLKKNEYQLYGTKTNYDFARKYINQLDEDDLPHSFDDDSLEKEHKDLVEDYCTPVVFYFFGRHAARFPDGEDIDLYNKRLNELKEVLKQDAGLQRCPEKLTQFVNWTSKMQPKQDNLITSIGAKQERDIARRFKKIYPEFFDTKKADIKIGVTTKYRTAQTGAEFLKEVEGLDLPNCSESALPTNDVYQASYDLDKILQNSCYKTLQDRYTLPFLEFHKQCEKIEGKQKVKNALLERLDDPKLLKDVIERVSEKLELPKDKQISPETLEALMDMCKFEQTFQESSIWCQLFEKKDIELIEYMKDIEVYIKNAYGPDAKSRQACPLIKDLVENFQDSLNMTGARDEKRKAYMYFSHAGPMKKLLAAFDVFKDDDSYTEQQIEEFLTRLKIDKDREWKTSLIIPFSANMAFVMYRCQKPGKQVKHKILSTVTETPVKLGKCKDTQCSSRKFFEAFDNMRDCDLNKICKS